MPKNNRIQKVEFEVKLLDIDYNNSRPAELIEKLGLVQIRLNAVAGMGFVERLTTFLENELKKATTRT